MSVFVLTGAGNSAESGLGTFRDRSGTGIWALRSDEARHPRSIRPRSRGCARLLQHASLQPCSRHGICDIADGLVSLVLPAYLLVLGYGPLETGQRCHGNADRLRISHALDGTLRTPGFCTILLMAASVLMILTGLAFAGFDDFWPLLLVSFVGTLNPSEDWNRAAVRVSRWSMASCIVYSAMGSVVAVSNHMPAGMREARP